MILFIPTSNLSNQEQYLDYSDILLATDATTELSVGDHEFPFSVPLEANIPSSFEGKHGHVRYKVTATIGVPQKKTEHFFTVLTPYDLNKNQDAQVGGLNLALHFMPPKMLISVVYFSCPSMKKKIKHPRPCSGNLIPYRQQLPYPGIIVSWIY